MTQLSPPAPNSDAHGFAQIKSLFAQVCDLPEPQRAQRLHELERDPQIVERVLLLFRRESVQLDAVGNSVIGILGSLFEPRPAQPSVGETIGAWTLESELGHGGMGTVFRAQRSDGHFEQVAALKLLRGVPTQQALARLALERQILARLTHPNIARLQDGGTTSSGQPYLVMEYVEGVPIDRYCAQERASPTTIARLLLGVCEALEYAHQRLVVHCDLKPSNIMVNPSGRAVLLDFGIARLLSTDYSDAEHPEAHHPSLSRQLAFTPEFASPEQQQGLAISAATDIFGLGRVLQVLLQMPKQAGEPQTEIMTASSAKLNNAEQAGVPKAASGNTPSRKGLEALLAVAQKATNANPALRYVSVSAFAEELRRFLEQRPVRAMDGNLPYRIACHVRRNALPLGLGAAALIALLAGLYSTNVNLLEARAQHSRAEIAVKRAERTTEFLGYILSGIDPDRARDLDKTLLREILESAARDAELKLVEEPQVLGQISAVIGRTFHALGEYAKAQSHLQTALTHLPPKRVRERLALMEQIALAKSAERRDDSALADYQAVYEQRLAAFGPLDVDTLTSAHNVLFQRQLAGEFRASLEAALALQPQLEQVLGPNHATTVQNLQAIAIARAELGEFEIAEPILQELIKRAALAFGPQSQKSFAIQTSVVIMYLRQKRFEDAQKLLHELYPLAKQVLGENNFGTINFAGLLASALRKGGKLAESGKFYAIALESALKKYGPDHGITMYFESNYANYELAMGLHSEALARCDALEPRFVALLGSTHPDIAELYRTQARALTALNRAPEAIKKWRLALVIDRGVFGTDTHPQVAEDLAALAALGNEATREK